MTSVVSYAAESHALLAAVGAHILKRSEPTIGPIDWAAFTQLAQQNKLFLQAVAGLGRSAPTAVTEAAERYRALTLRLNGANLVSTRAIVAALSAAGIEPVVIKGPLAQRQLYGDYFARPSSDVDLLVARREFRAAGLVLAAAGYRRAAPCASPWWRVFLGEEHYLSAVREGVSADLHHRVQQPGCPGPTQPDIFMRETATCTLGNQRVRALAPAAALLLACMSLVKGIVHREPAGAYASDVAAHISLGAPQTLPAASELAKSAGLFNTLQAGLRAADVLFGVHAAGANPAALAVATDEELIALILAPQTARRRPRRTQILWALSDNANDFTRELTWKVSADALRAPLAALALRQD